jgi:gamma-glutamylcyclotransferase (GGCT)/AIG2-like uncharacterized protein YtfP
MLMAGQKAYLFVYGTLRRSCNNKFARMLHDEAPFLGNARMRGRLYRIGWYPGAVASKIDGEWVRGELYSITDSRWLVEALDSYEGSEQFERVKLEVERDWGERVDAWVYLYRGTPSGPRIRSGDWLRA